MQEKIVITGMGAISPIGNSVDEAWKNAVSGVSGVAPITLFDASEYQVKIACEVKSYNPENYMPAREVRRRDRFEQFAVIAAQEAIQQSGIGARETNTGRVGVIISSAIGGLAALEENIITLKNDGPRRVSPFTIPMLMANGAAGLVAIENGYKGPCLSIASACASGADALGTAWLLLRSGVIDIAIAGASEATITDIGVACFDRLGAMSRRNDSTAPQPFDLNRDGLVMGEGAAILVMEKEMHARSRGAQILAEFAGYAAACDAFHITAPDESGSGGAQAMKLAIESAGLNPSDVDYINAHGTATLLNDVAETRAIKTTFGDFAYNIPVSSTKSMTGHMMGATGALEAVFIVQSVREGIVPPTINYQTPDPQCDLDYVPNQARQVQVNVAISNALGFGGHNSVVVIKAYSE